MALIFWFQIFSAACWMLVAMIMAAAAWRSFFGRARFLDPIFSVFFFMGVLQTGFVVRWALFPRAVTSMVPAELYLWTGLYALCGILALWALIVAGAYRDKQL